MKDLAVADKLHRSEETYLHNADIIRDYAGRFGPGDEFFSSLQLQRVPGSSASMRRTFRKETGTAKRCRISDINS